MLIDFVISLQPGAAAPGEYPVSIVLSVYTGIFF